MKNNFQQLEEEYENRFPIPGGEERKVSSTFSFLRHIGNVVEHFLGRASEILVTIAGGDNKRVNKTPPNLGGGVSRNDVPPRRPH